MSAELWFASDDVTVVVTATAGRGDGDGRMVPPMVDRFAGRLADDGGRHLGGIAAPRQL